MPFETSRPLRLFPTATTGLSLAAGSGVTPGAWTEVWAATAADIVVAGFAVDKATAGTTDVQLGIGAGGSEVVIASQRVQGNPASQRFNELFPIPFRIAAGTRVALRTRITAIVASLQYFDAYDSDNFAELFMAVSPVSVSSVINGAIVVPGDSWVWGDWVELTAGDATAIGIYGLAVGTRRINEEYEWEIGIDDPPVPIATIPSYVVTNDAGRLSLQLPAIWWVAPTVPVSVRLRTESNSAFTSNHRATLQYYIGPPVIADPPGGGTPTVGIDPNPGLSLCGAEIPIPWVEVQTDGPAKVYAVGDIALDTVHKDARVLSFGPITRALSSMEGALETATQTIELSDHDRALRGMAEAGTLLNKQVDTYVSTKAGILARAIPRRVFHGIIRGYKALPDLKFRLHIEDFFSALMNMLKGQKTLPQRALTVADFPNLPLTLIGKAVPLLYGLCSDESAGFEALGVVPAMYVGDRVVDGETWGEFLICGHAVTQIQSVFVPVAGGLSDGTAEPARVKVTTDSATILIPGHPNWATRVGADAFVDYNGNRYTVVFMRGDTKVLAAEGKVPLALNVAGIEDAGDGTGDLIDSLPYQTVHLLTNFMLQNYRAGPWLPIPVVGGFVGTEEQFLIQQVEFYRWVGEGDARLKTFFYASTIFDYDLEMSAIAAALDTIITGMAVDEEAAFDAAYALAVGTLGFVGTERQFLIQQVEYYRWVSTGDQRLLTFFYDDTITDYDAALASIDAALTAIIAGMAVDELAAFNAAYVRGAAYSVISTSTFDTVHDHMIERNGPDGYLGAFMLGWQGQVHAWRDVIRDLLKSGAWNLGINKDGQIMAAIRDPDATLVKHWDHVLDIVDGSFDADRNFSALANYIPYRYQQRYVAPVATITPATGAFLPASIKKDVKDWLVEYFTESTLSQAKHAGPGDDGVRPYPLDLAMVRDTSTADNVAAQVKVERKDGPVEAMWAVNLCGTDVELGGRQTVTHFEGLTATGWTARSTRVERMVLNLDGMTQTFGVRDLEAITADE